MTEINKRALICLCSILISTEIFVSIKGHVSWSGFRTIVGIQYDLNFVVNHRPISNFFVTFSPCNSEG